MGEFDHGARVIVAGDIDDSGSTGKGEAAVTDRVRPGMTGTVLFTDGQGTAHIQWDAGFRRGVENGQGKVLRRVIAAADHRQVTEVHGEFRGPFLIVCAAYDPGDRVRRGWAHCPGCFLKHYNPDGDSGHLVWTVYQSGARRFGTVEHALRAWRDDGPLSSYAIAIIEAP